MTATPHTAMPVTISRAPVASVAAARTALPWGLWWATATIWGGAVRRRPRARPRRREWLSAQSLPANVASHTLWVVLTVFALWLAERAPIDRHSWRWSAPLALAAAAGVVLLRALVVTLANPIVGWYGEQPPYNHPSQPCC